MTCMNPVEIFPAAASAFIPGKNNVPVIFVTCISPVEVFPAAAGAFLGGKMTFLTLYDMY